MSNTFIVFIDESESSFKYTETNSIAFYQMSNLWQLSFKQLMNNQYLFTIKVYDQPFYAVFNANFDNIPHLDLNEHCKLSLEVLISFLSFSLEINKEGWPIALKIYQKGSKSKIVDTLILKWMSIEEQISSMYESQYKLIHYTNQIYTMQDCINSKADSTQISKLALDIETLTNKYDNLDKTLKCLKNMQNSRIEIIESNLESKYKEFEVLNEMFYSRLADAELLINQYLLRIDNLDSQINSVKNRLEENELLLPTPNEIETLKDQQLEKSVSLNKFELNLQSQRNYVSEQFDKIKQQLALISETPNLDIFTNFSEKLEEQHKLINFIVDLNIPDLLKTSIELSSKLSLVNDQMAEMEYKIKINQDQVISQLDPIKQRVYKLVFPSLDELQTFSIIKDEFNSKDIQLKAVEKHDRKIFCCLDLNEAEYIIGCDDGSIHFIDKFTHRLILTKSLIKEHTKWIKSLILIENKLVSGSEDGLIKVWNLNNTTKNSLNTLLHGGLVYTLILLKDQLIASGGSCDFSIKIWDISNSNCIHSLKNHTNTVFSLLMLENNTLISASKDKSLRLWIISDDLSKSYQVRFIASDREFRSILHLSSLIIALGTLSGPIDLWNIETSKLVKSLTGHSGWVFQIIRLSPRLVASCGQDSTVRIWDLEAMEQCNVLQKHTDEVNGLLRLSSLEIISISDDKTIRKWTVLK